MSEEEIRDKLKWKSVDESFKKIGKIFFRDHSRITTSVAKIAGKIEKRDKNITELLETTQALLRSALLYLKELLLQLVAKSLLMIG